MTHAVVLIKAERVRCATLGERLADVDGVAEAYSVTGEWDFVAMLRVRSTTSSPRRSPAGSPSLDGIADTYTMVAFQVFSHHDLEALFSVGA